MFRRKANNNDLPASIYFYIGGCLFFLAFAKFYITGWKQFYYLWSFTKDFLFIYTIYLIKPKLRKELYPILFFAAIRAIWETISIATTPKLDPNNRIKVNYLFYLMLAIVTVHLLNRLRKKWKQKF